LGALGGLPAILEGIWRCLRLIASSFALALSGKCKWTSDMREAVEKGWILSALGGLPAIPEGIWRHQGLIASSFVRAMGAQCNSSGPKQGGSGIVGYLICIRPRRLESPLPWRGRMKMRRLAQRPPQFRGEAASFCRMWHTNAQRCCHEHGENYLAPAHAIEILH